MNTPDLAYVHSVLSDEAAKVRALIRKRREEERPYDKLATRLDRLTKASELVESDLCGDAPCGS